MKKIGEIVSHSRLEEMLFDDVSNGLKKVGCLGKDLVKLKTCLKGLNAVVVVVRVAFVVEKGV